MGQESQNSPVRIENLNPHYGDRYFSEGEGLAETRQVFLAGNDLPQALRGKTVFNIGETGFGTGLNLLALAEAAESFSGSCQIHWWSVEKYPLATQAVRELLAPFANSLVSLEPFLSAWDRRLVDRGWFTFALPVATGSSAGKPESSPAILAHIWIGDILEMLKDLPRALVEWGFAPTAIDAWLLDGHSPSLNPDMWSQAVFDGIAAASHPANPATGQSATSLATYTAAGLVKQGLRQAGFRVKRYPGFGAKRHMVRAWYGLA